MIVIQNLRLVLDFEELEDGTLWAQIGRESNGQMEWPMELTGFSDASSLLEEAVSLIDAMLFHWLMIVSVAAPTPGATG